MIRLTIAMVLVLTTFACDRSASGPAAGRASEPTEERGSSHDDEHGDEHDENDAGLVVLTAAQVEAAAITFQAVGPGRIETLLELTATAAVNRDAQAHVNPRIGGLVNAIHVQLGEFVTAGTPLCELDSVELGKAAGEFLSAQATVQATEDTLKREMELLAGSVDLARAVFERERNLAEKELTTLSAQYEAERTLLDAELGRDSRMLELESRLGRERIDLSSAERTLELLGRSHDELDAMAANGDQAHAPLGAYILRAPRDGVIMSRDVTESEFVDTGTTLFVIQDLGRMWVEAWVHEGDLASVRVGAPATLALDAFPGVPFQGTVGFIDYRIEPRTRAAAVRIEVDNTPLASWPERFPIRPGMFGRVQIVTGLHDVALSLPEQALVHEPEGEFVFVELEPGRYEQRAVQLGKRTRDRVEIVAGLQAGERVAINGTFVLKSAARAGEVGEGHAH